MRVLVLTADLGGNVPPAMAIARELCRRGADVGVAGILLDPAGAGGDATGRPPKEVAASWAPRRDASGAPLPLGPTLGRIFFSRRLAAETEALIHEQRPDVVVIDCMGLAMLKGAHRTGIPDVVLLHTFAEYWRRVFLHGPIAAMAGAIGFSPRALWGSAASRLLVTDRGLDPAGQAPEFVDYVWTGTTEVGEAPPARDSPGAAPRVVVSFSTTPLAGMRRTYRNVIEALRGLPVEGIVTTGGYDLGDAVPSAPNVQVRGYVPHAEVFPGAALLIGHGGHSTTMKALAHGIPMLVLPLNPTADQALIGEVIEAAGLGRKLSARSGVATIRQAVAELLDSRSVRDRARDTGIRLRASAPGADVAADHIQRAARSDAAAG